MIRDLLRHSKIGVRDGSLATRKLSAYQNRSMGSLREFRFSLAILLRFACEGVRKPSLFWNCLGGYVCVCAHTHTDTLVNGVRGRNAAMLSMPKISRTMADWHGPKKNVRQEERTRSRGKHVQVKCFPLLGGKKKSSRL